MAYCYQSSFFNTDKSKKLFDQVIAKPEETRKIVLHHEYTDKDVSIYEQALYQVREVEYIDKLLTEIPDTKIRKEAVSKKASLLAFPKPGREYENVAEFYQTSLQEFPDNSDIKMFFIYYATFQKKDLDNATKVADKWYAEGGDTDMVFMSIHARLLDLQNDSVQLLRVLYSTNLEF